MAWNPDAYTGELYEAPQKPEAQEAGEEQADELPGLPICIGYNGRVTPKCWMPSYNTNHEWKLVADDYTRLEAEGLYASTYLWLPRYRDAYKQLLLFPVQAISTFMKCMQSYES